MRRHTRVDRPPPPRDGVLVGGAWLTAGGTRLYVGGNLGEEPDLRCVIWSIDTDTLQYIGPVIEIDHCPPMPNNGVSANADASLVAFTYPGPEDWATDIYDGRTGEKLNGPLRGRFTNVIAPDGTLVGGDVSGEVTQYDLATLEPIGRFPQARGRVEALEFTADGSLLLIGSANQTVTLNDVANRSQLGDPIDTGRPLVGGNAGPVLRPDGQAVTVNGRDGLAIWNLDPDHLAHAACDLAGRNLTKAEWDTHLGNLGAYRATCPDHA